MRAEVRFRVSVNNILCGRDCEYLSINEEHVAFCYLFNEALSSSGRPVRDADRCDECREKAVITEK